MEPLELKEMLIRIKENNYELENEKIYPTAEKMLDNIGTIDSEIRDHLIYTTFVHWIIYKKYFTHDELREILVVVLDDRHLFYKIGNENDDSVFTRAFSILVIALIIYRNRNERFLIEKEQNELKQKVIKYFQEEKDYRGFVDGKGWAHAIAHGADALDELAQSSFLNYEDFLQILQVIKYKIAINNYTYVHEEDERIVTAVVNILKQDVLTQNEFINWIQSFEAIELPTEHQFYHHPVINIKSFLRSLYFRILEQETMDEILKQIKVTLYNLNQFK